MSPQDQAKRRAAARALDFVQPGMKLGLGSGSTAALFVDLLGERVAQGLEILGVPTSEATRLQAQALGIPLSDLAATPALDLTIDGADEFDARLRLIKGGGGALLREKIVAAASADMLVIADSSKKVADLGAFPLPVEVDLFGLDSTRIHVTRLCARFGAPIAPKLRRNQQGEIFITDGGHAIFDCAMGRIDAPELLAQALNATPGVIEHGLFIGMARRIVVADLAAIEVIQA